MEIITVPRSQQRDIATVTAEIRFITDKTRRMVVDSIVEIGRRLEEAKSMLPHGEWGRWLAEEVEFKQSTANNYMRIYREYADGQITLDGAVANSQTIGSLSYTKALKLLALPAEEREDFAESHDVEGMSNRQLDDALAQLKAEREGRERAEEQLRDAAKMVTEIKDASEQLRAETDKQIQQAEAAARAAEDRLRAAEHKAKIAETRVKDAEQAMAEARHAAKNAEANASKAFDKERKKIADEAREATAKEIEKLKAKAEKDKAELEKAQAAAKAAKEEAEKAAAEARAATMEAEGLRHKLAASSISTAMQAFKTSFEQVQRDFDGMVAKIAAMDEEEAGKCRAATLKLIEHLKGVIAT